MGRWRPRETGKRFLSVFLSLLIIMGYVMSSLPLNVIASDPDAGRTVGYQTETDPETHTDWTDSFGPDASDTSDAGRIWTDKTVWDSNVNLQPAGINVVRSSAENLLVGLSAISSNKSVLGESALPVDVVFVLDMSASMNGSRFNNMYPAVNQAIDKLLNDERLHRDNRVGIVTYSTDTTELLPLGEYTTVNGQYVNGNNNTLSLNGNLKNEDGSNVTYAQVRTGSATNIQDGILRGAEMLEQADGKDVEGVKRIPILIVMSDGVPTTANENYTGEGQNGTNVSSRFDRLSEPLAGFLTQLTGQYAKEQVADAYGRDALVYTLGLAVNNDGRAVLDPTNYRNNSDLNDLWDAFSSVGKGDRYTTYNRSPIERYEDTLTTNKYNDQYFASAEGELESAFDAIVEQIIIQSRYYPTDNETVGGEQNFTGYLTFEDEIGQFMEVKNINGIVSGDQMISGAAFADAIVNHDGSYGTATGDNFVWSIQQRLGFQEGEAGREQARQLIIDAYNDGQISYTNDTDYSNYIAWYSDADKDYLGFAKKDMSNKTDDAVYFNRSYTFYGAAAGVQDSTDLMYVTVRVETEIATGNQKMIVKIPSSLVPLVMYEASIRGDNVSEADTGEISRKAAYPIRLFYEVGLRSDINEFNVKDKVGDSYPYQDQNDSDLYHFYSNAWTDADHANTLVTFDPNEMNEFYYFSKNTTIYTDPDCRNPLRSEPQKGRTYYYLKNVFSVDDSAQTGEKHPSTITHKGVEITEESLFGEDGAHKNYTRSDDGSYYVKIGTPKTATGTYQRSKTQNSTGTASHFIYPTIGYDNQQDIHVNVRLGNNGRFSLEQQEGIMIEKQFDADAPNPDPEQSFTFTVKLAGRNIAANYPMTVFTADGERIDSKAQVQNDTITLSLKEGERAYITGLEAGVTYTVSENDVAGNTDYLLKEVTKDGVEDQDKLVEGTIAVDKIDELVFVNQYVETAQITVMKTVSGNYVDPNRSFAFDMTVGGEAYPGFSLKNQGSTTIRVPVGAEIVIRETNAANYDTTVTANPQVGSSNGQTFTLDTMPDENVTVTFNNAFDAQPVSVPIAFDGIKTIIDREFLPGDNFSFEVRDANNNVVSNGTLGDTIDEHNKKIEFDPIQIAHPGTYTYTVAEVIPMQGGLHGISYDPSTYRLVIVVEEASNGGLTVASQTLTKNGAGADEILFENTYTPDEINVRLQVNKVINNQSGADVDYKDFEFVAIGNGGTYNGVVDDNGRVTFTVPVKSDGTFTYQITETPGSDAAIAYDGKTVTATVIINADDQTGDLYVDDITYTNQATFTNTVTGNPDSVTVNGTKTLDGRNFLHGDDFVFQVYPSDANGNINGAGENAVFSKTSDNTANLTWSKEFDKVGTYYFVFDEAEGSVKGISYDKTRYLIQVDVTHDLQDTSLDATASIIKKTDADGNFQTVTGVTSADFTNTYQAAPTTLDLPFSKTIEDNGTGRGWQDNDRFTVVLFRSNDDTFQTVTYAENKTLTKTAQNGKFTVQVPGDGTYYYQIRENRENQLPGFSYSTAVYNLIVTADTNPATGLLEADYEIVDSAGKDMEFVNEYRAVPVSTTIQASKVFTNSTNYMGKKITDFEFELSRSGSPTQTAKPDGRGNISFATETFDKVGEYVYTLREIPGTDGIDYDPSEYQITVKVSDNKTGNLVASVDYGTAGNTPVQFKNTLSIKEKAQVTVKGVKNLDGRDLKDQEFQFTMQPSNSAGEVAGDPEESIFLTASNDADGNFAFDLTFDSLGEFYYVISEKNNGLGGVGYDDTRYLVKINITHKDGDLSKLTSQTTITELGGNRTSVEFDNTYQATPAKAGLTVNKVLDGRDWQDDDSFDFQLTKMSRFLFWNLKGDKEVFQLTKDATSCNVFDGMEFEEGTYTYLLEELKPDDADPNLSYDDTQYKIVIDVTDDAEGSLKAKLSIFDNKDNTLIYETEDYTVQAEGEVTFTNVYTEPEPEPVPPEEPSNPEPEPEPEPETDLPKTNDDLKLWPFGLAILVSGGALTCLVCIKRRRKHD